MNATTTKDTMRLFYALWPDDATRDGMMKVQTNMHGRLTRYENLHITLVFLGEQPASLLPDLKDILNHLPRTDLPLTLDCLGYFPRKRIAWLGMRDAPQALVGLQSRLAEALVQRGVAFDNRGSFKPHVTLARDATPPPDIVFDPIDWKANQVALVQSKTGPDGVSYEVLASRSLEEDVWTSNELGQDALDTGR